LKEKEIMAHRHLVLAYVITLVVQLGYAGWVGLKYRAMRKLERAFPAYPSTPR
jgi:hydroxypyruvate isomerase